MTSKEALEKLLDHYETYSSIDGCEKLIKSIEQDLDKLEKLEKENKHLKLFYNEIIDCIKGFNNSEE